MALAKSQDILSIKKMASDIVERASSEYSSLRNEMSCTTCTLLPLEPITCFCGHTRCSNCITHEPLCPCGIMVPVRDIRRNVMIQDLVTKLLGPISTLKENSPTLLTPKIGNVNSRKRAACRVKRLGQFSKRIVCAKGRYKYVRVLVRYGMYMDAAANLVLVAASKQPLVSLKAMDKLLKVVQELGLRWEQGQLIQKLQSAAQTICANSYLNAVSVEDLECPVCYEVMQSPVTTPCGHTFCRWCIMNSLKFQQQCPFCKEDMDQLDIILRRDTAWISTMIMAKMIPSPLAPEINERLRELSDLIPMFRCAVAFPTTPCPFLVLGPHLQNMLQRIMSCGLNKIGMVTTCNDGSIASYGTVVQVKDCLELEDGSTVLTTIGISRFETIERTPVSGGYIARASAIKDIPLSRAEYDHLQLEQLAESITRKVVQLLMTLKARVTAEIVRTNGPMPHYRQEDEWWMDPEGPRWLWWIIAILPIKTGLQVLMLSTTSLHKRMLSVSRSLDMIQYITE